MIQNIILIPVNYIFQVSIESITVKRIPTRGLDPFFYDLWITRFIRFVKKPRQNQ